jgi:hypothetical protein
LVLAIYVSTLKHNKILTYSPYYGECTFIHARVLTPIVYAFITRAQQRLNLLVVSLIMSSLFKISMQIVSCIINHR